MRFALLGDHPDGLEMARALVKSGRFTLLAYSGSALGIETLARQQIHPTTVPDPEEILADPAIELVIVASPPDLRWQHLKRVLQSERHALCVHPLHYRADTAYEASTLQSDVKVLLLPILPEAFHPALARLTELVTQRMTAGWQLEWERHETGELWLDLDSPGGRPAVPGWDVLRRLGGEIAEVFAMAEREEIVPDQPMLVTGRFQPGGMYRVSFWPRHADNRWRFLAKSPTESMELIFPQGWPGPAELTYRDDHGQTHTEHFPAANPWEKLIEGLERDLIERPHVNVSWTAPASRLGWLDAIRALELDENVRRSLHYRRAYTLDFQEATEEASFKGTMTLVGCSLIWISLLLLILSAWVPWLGWLIPIVLAGFLILQLLGWAIPDKEKKNADSGPSRGL